MSLTSALDVTERVRPPRSGFLDFPLGNQAGPPGDPELQRRIVRDALTLLSTATSPGEIVRLPYEWPDPEWRHEVVETYRRDSATVSRQRRDSEFDADGNFAARECVEVCRLI